MSNPALDFPEVHCLIESGAIPKIVRSPSANDFPRRKSSGKHRHSCTAETGSRKTRKSGSDMKKRSRKLSREEKAIEEKRKRTVCIVVGIFLFILFSCVLVVIVTLTHQSEYAKRNTTHSYYTFAPPAVHPELPRGNPFGSPTTTPTPSAQGERRIDELDDRPGP